jgi:hypothetical protein
VIWVMGYVARNAVASVWPEFPRDTCEISCHPYPGQAPGAPRFFVSRYLTRAPRKEVDAIFREFCAFWERSQTGGQEKETRSRRHSYLSGMESEAE